MSDCACVCVRARLRRVVDSLKDGRAGCGLAGSQALIQDEKQPQILRLAALAQDDRAEVRRFLEDKCRSFDSSRCAETRSG
jgi:hypothetical protein